jgi:amino acid transporter
VYPYLDFLTAAISNNVAVGTFIIIVAIVQLWWYQANAVFVGSRLLLSYSFDRIAPYAFADLSPRFHAPVKGMIACLAIGLLAGVLFLLPSTAPVAFLMSSAAVAIILLFPIAVVGIALLTFRYKWSKEYAASPIAKSYLGGPVYVIAAVVTIIYAVYTFYQYISVPAIFGFAGTEGLEVIFIPIILLFAFYIVSRYIGTRKGADFRLIYSRIPPE